MALAVVPTGKTSQQLKKTGKAKVKVSVTYTPGGPARTKTEIVTLVEKQLLSAW